MKILKKENFEILSLLILIVPLLFVYTFAIHEPAHYLACILQGHAASINITPGMGGQVDCSDLEGFSPYGQILHYMAPYVAGIFLLIILSKTKNKSGRLIAYAAFFNIQENLTLSIFNDAFFKIKGLDPFGMLYQINRLYPSYELQGLLTIYFLIILSILIFYIGYRQDFIHSKDKRFLRWAFTIFFANLLMGELFVIFFVVPHIPKTP